MDTVVEVEGLRKRYGDTVALDGLDLRIRAGEIFGIVGPNGAGKSTLVETIVGLRTPDAGRVRVLGGTPDDADVRERVGVQLQSAALPDRMRVEESLDLFASYYRRSVDRRELLVAWGLAEKRKALFSSLSGGQRQRLFVALALVNDPEVVVLDELTTGLDPEVRRTTWELVREIRERGRTVVLVTHHMDEVERLCDRVAVVQRGRVIALDSPAGLLAATGERTLEDAYFALTAAGQTRGSEVA